MSAEKRTFTIIGVDEITCNKPCVQHYIVEDGLTKVCTHPSAPTIGYNRPRRFKKGIRLNNCRSCVIYTKKEN